MKYGVQIMALEQRNYYLPSEIRGLLLAAGKPKSTFYTLVRQGKIKTLTHEDIKVYDKANVDAFLQGKLHQDGRKKATRGSSQNGTASQVKSNVSEKLPLIEAVRQHEDVGDAFTIEAGLLGWSQAVFPENIEKWTAQNSYTYWLLREPDTHEACAVLGVLPLREEIIQQLLKGEISSKDIKAEDVLPYEPGREYSCYVTSAAAITEQYDAVLPLMQRIFSYWCDVAHVHINRIYALSNITTEALPLLRLAQEYSFSIVSELSGQDRLAWVLRTDLYNYSPIVQQFQKCQKEQKEKNYMIPLVADIHEEVKDRDPRLRLADPQGYFTPSARFKFAESEADVREIVRINRALFGAGSALTEDQVVALLRSWWEVNREVFQVLEVDGAIVGYVSLLPLPMSVIKGIMSDDIRVSQIRPTDIQPYEPGRAVDLYIWTVGLHPNFHEPEQTKRNLGRYLLQGVIGMFKEFGERGIEIRSAWARSDTPDGIGISKGLGFEEVRPTPSKSGKPVFKLDMVWSDKTFVVMYIKALMAYRDGRQVGSEV